ncbi:MAG: glycosyltransferase [Actinomycetes bacterium]
MAFRGGGLAGEATRLAPTTILLDPGEAWDHDQTSSERAPDLRRATQELGEPDVTLLVSVAAGHSLPYLPEPVGAVVCWVVEQGEDLSWLKGPTDLLGRTSTWLAGASNVADELAPLLPPGTDVRVVPEFVDAVRPADEQQVSNCRRALDPEDSQLLVVGAGIATYRKAPDLFYEAAAAHASVAQGSTGWAWLGGERDPLFYPVVEQARCGPVARFRMFGDVDDVVPWVAAADVVLHPARLDAFPLVCLHAVLAGTPVVSFAGAGGVGEMLGPTFMGVTYPDLHGLAQIVESLRDESLRSEVTAAQTEWARNRFSTDVAAPLLLEQLEAAAGATP